MLELDGIEYSVKTPDENVSDLIGYINSYCQSNGITNSKGEIIYIDKNTTNPLYMMCYGISYLTTVLQKLIYSAGCSMSVPESSERQLLNIADIAGVTRTQATKTIITGTVYANEEDTGAVDCVITTDLSATVSSGTYSVVFHPAFDMTVPIGESRQIVLICEDYGAYNISENTITQFDNVVAGFRKMVTLASTPGQEQESIASLRNRIQKRSVEGTQADRAAEAIQSLDGVSLCNIYFNSSPSTTAVIGTRNIEVAPRKALLMVQGWSDGIAQAFYNHMICETAGANLPSSYGVQVQYYETKAGQKLPVYIVPPSQIPVYIKIYIYESLTYSQIDGIKDVICSLASSLSIGQAITSKMVTDIVAASYTDLTIQGADISKDNENFAYSAIPESDELFIFNVENLSVVEVSGTVE